MLRVIKNILPDKLFLKLKFYKVFHKKLNLRKPHTFNEKIQWLKLYDRKIVYSTMVDKYDSKRYVSNLIGEEYIIPTLEVYENFDDIDFEELPDQFVIKCTHDSGGSVICKNKKEFNKEIARKKIIDSLNNNYYYNSREWPYKNVKPRIIIEPYLEDKRDNELRDYKFFCFNGKVKIFKIDFNRYTNHQANYYDVKGELLPFGEVVCPPDYEKKLRIPNNLTKMIELAEKLSENTKFLRVDFYEVDNKIYFGELTFYPNSGFGKFTDEKWDEVLGEWITLEGDD